MVFKTKRYKNLKDVKSRSLRKAGRGWQRSNKKWHRRSKAQPKNWSPSPKLFLYLHFCHSFFSLCILCHSDITNRDNYKTCKKLSGSEIAILQASKNNNFANLPIWLVNTWVSMWENLSNNWFKNCNFWTFLFLLIPFLILLI